MSQVIIPLAAIPNQTLTTVLNNQNCRINIYQKSTGLFIDLTVNDVVVFTGVLCLDRNFMVFEEYFNFVGDLAFIDLQGVSDPDYTLLGSRFVLAYFYP